LKILNVNIIAEIGSNWLGNVELAKKYIQKSKESGASHVKFQMWRARDLYDDTHSNWNEIKKSELTESVAKELKNFSDKIGIKWFASVFYPEAVDFLQTLNVPLYKIASRTSTLKDPLSVETIQKVSHTNKMTFISTGEGADLKKIEDQFVNKNFEFTYCVSNYPTLDDDINFQNLMKFNFFSDHTMGITIPIAYALLKQSSNEEKIYIEKHVKLNDAKGPDASFSITFDEVRHFSDHIQRIKKLKINNLFN